MTQIEISRYRQALESRVRELDWSARSRDSIAVVRSADEIDRMHDARQREIAVRGLEAVATNLRQVRAALKRIDDRTFGTCLECEEEISAKRLAAAPWATLCIECQRSADSRQRECPEDFFPAAA